MSESLRRRGVPRRTSKSDDWDGGQDEGPSREEFFVAREVLPASHRFMSYFSDGDDTDATSSADVSPEKVKPIRKERGHDSGSVTEGDAADRSATGCKNSASTTTRNRTATPPHQREIQTQRDEERSLRVVIGALYTLVIVSVLILVANSAGNSKETATELLYERGWEGPHMAYLVGLGALALFAVFAMVYLLIALLWLAIDPNFDVFRFTRQWMADTVKKCWPSGGEVDDDEDGLLSLPDGTRRRNVVAEAESRANEASISLLRVLMFGVYTVVTTGLVVVVVSYATDASTLDHLANSDATSQSASHLETHQQTFSSWQGVRSALLGAACALGLFGGMAVLLVLFSLVISALAPDLSFVQFSKFLPFPSTKVIVGGTIAVIGVGLHTLWIVHFNEGGGNGELTAESVDARIDAASAAIEWRTQRRLAMQRRLQRAAAGKVDGSMASGAWSVVVASVLGLVEFFQPYTSSVMPQATPEVLLPYLAHIAASLYVCIIGFVLWKAVKIAASRISKVPAVVWILGNWQLVFAATVLIGGLLVGQDGATDDIVGHLDDNASSTTHGPTAETSQFPLGNGGTVDGTLDSTGSLLDQHDIFAASPHNPQSTQLVGPLMDQGHFFSEGHSSVPQIVAATAEVEAQIARRHAEVLAAELAELAAVHYEGSLLEETVITVPYGPLLENGAFFGDGHSTFALADIKQKQSEAEAEAQRIAEEAAAVAEIKERAAARAAEFAEQAMASLNRDYGDSTEERLEGYAGQASLLDEDVVEAPFGPLMEDGAFFSDGHSSVSLAAYRRTKAQDGDNKVEIHDDARDIRSEHAAAAAAAAAAASRRVEMNRTRDSGQTGVESGIKYFWNFVLLPIAVMSLFGACGWYIMLRIPSGHGVDDTLGAGGTDENSADGDVSIKLTPKQMQAKRAEQEARRTDAALKEKGSRMRRLFVAALVLILCLLINGYVLVIRPMQLQRRLAGGDDSSAVVEIPTVTSSDDQQMNNATFPSVFSNNDLHDANAGREGALSAWDVFVSQCWSCFGLLAWGAVCIQLYSLAMPRIIRHDPRSYTATPGSPWGLSTTELQSPMFTNASPLLKSILHSPTASPATPSGAKFVPTPAGGRPPRPGGNPKQTYVQTPGGPGRTGAGGASSRRGSSDYEWVLRDVANETKGAHRTGDDADEKGLPKSPKSLLDDEEGTPREPPTPPKLPGSLLIAPGGVPHMRAVKEGARLALHVLDRVHKQTHLDALTDDQRLAVLTKELKLVREGKAALKRLVETESRRASSLEGELETRQRRTKQAADHAEVERQRGAMPTLCPCCGAHAVASPNPIGGIHSPNHESSEHKHPHHTSQGIASVPSPSSSRRPSWPKNEATGAKQSPPTMAGAAGGAGEVTSNDTSSTGYTTPSSRSLASWFPEDFAFMPEDATPIKPPVFAATPGGGPPPPPPPPGGLPSGPPLPPGSAPPPPPPPGGLLSSAKKKHTGPSARRPLHWKKIPPAKLEDTIFSPATKRRLSTIAAAARTATRARSQTISATGISVPSTNGNDDVGIPCCDEDGAGGHGGEDSDPTALLLAAGDAGKLIIKRRMEIVDLFFEDKEAIARERALARGDTGANKAKKKVAVSLLSLVRANNISISLSRFPGGAAAVRRALLSLDSSILNAEQLAVITPLLPSVAEAKLLKSTTHKAQDLGTAEQFLLSMVDVPLLHERTAAFLFSMELPSRAEEALARLKRWAQAAQSVRESAALRGLLLTTLTAGNFVNCGHMLGNAVAFSIDSALLLGDIRASDKVSTLAHYVVAVAEACGHADWLDLPCELKAIDDALTYPIEMLAGDVALMSSSLQRLGMTLRQLHAMLDDIDDSTDEESESAVSDGDGDDNGMVKSARSAAAADVRLFIERMTPFATEANSIIDNIDAELQNARTLFHEMVVYLGEPAPEPCQVDVKAAELLAVIREVARSIEQSCVDVAMWKRVNAPKDGNVLPAPAKASDTGEVDSPMKGKSKGKAKKKSKTKTADAAAAVTPKALPF